MQEESKKRINYNMKALVTGSAGFIGFHLAKKLIQHGCEVVGLDNINDYYSPQLKYARLDQLGIKKAEIKWYQLTKSSRYENYHFIRMNLEDKQQLFHLLQNQQFDFVINLAAQAGVRYSIDNPDVYIQSNIIGVHYLLEACRYFKVKHLVHASSSSVYGANAKIPFSEEDKTDNPVSLYAATKKSNELMAHAYSHLYNIPITCLRFFTVYGPWGRPDMAPMLFAEAIIKDREINVFNNGNMERDFTYIDDIVAGIYGALMAEFDTALKFRVLNIGNGAPVNLMDFISEMEQAFEKTGIKKMMPMQDGDVPKTWASNLNLEAVAHYKPQMNIRDGIAEFAKWYQWYFKEQLTEAQYK